MSSTPRALRPRRRFVQAVAVGLASAATVMVAGFRSVPNPATGAVPGDRAEVVAVEEFIELDGLYDVTVVLPDDTTTTFEAKTDDGAQVTVGDTLALERDIPGREVVAIETRASYVGSSALLLWVGGLSLLLLTPAMVYRWFRELYHWTRHPTRRATSTRRSRGARRRVRAAPSQPRRPRVTRTTATPPTQRSDPSAAPPRTVPPSDHDWYGDDTT